MDIQSASRSGLILVAHKPAEVCRLHHREPVPPAVRATVQTVIQRANPASHTGEMGGIACLCLPPIVEDCGFTQLCPRSGRQIIRLHFHRTGQEPQVVFRRLFKPFRIH